jgi:hypothetical protein
VADPQVEHLANEGAVTIAAAPHHAQRARWTHVLPAASLIVDAIAAEINERRATSCGRSSSDHDRDAHRVKPPPGALIDDDPAMPATVRASIVVLAVAACAWFALAVRAARDSDRATAIVSSKAPLTAAQAAHARSLLDAAATLNPDTAVDLLRARVALARNDETGAVRTILNVTKREPLNLEAWVALAQAALQRNQRLVLLAVHNIGRLDPKIK